MSDNNNNTDDVMESPQESRANKNHGLLHNLAAGRLRRAAKKVTRKAKRASKRAVKTALKKGMVTLGAKIATALIAVFMIVGMVVFIMTVPGMITNSITEKISNVWNNKVIAFIIGNDAVQLDEEHMKKTELNILQYVNDMGIDIVGFGFAASASIDENNKVESYETSWIPDSMFDGAGNAKDKIIDTIQRSKIYEYAVATTRTYLVNDETVVSKLLGINTFRGMLNIVTEDDENDENDDRTLGEKLKGFFNKIEVNMENKTLEIGVWNPDILAWMKMDNYSYNLEGWTGRYGIPIDLTLALHIATMSSGLTQELISHEDLQSQVDIQLQKITGDLRYKIQNRDGSIELYYDTKNDVDLVEMFVNGGKPKHDEISIVGIIDLIRQTQTEVLYPEYGIYNESTGLELKSSGRGFGGLRKVVDAMNAVSGNTGLYVSPSNRLYVTSLMLTESGEGSNIAQIYDGAYICSESNGRLDETTGMLAAQKSDPNTHKVQRYEKDDGGYKLITSTDGTENQEYYIANPNSENTGGGEGTRLQYVRLGGLLAEFSNKDTNYRCKDGEIRERVRFGIEIDKESGNVTAEGLNQIVASCRHGEEIDTSQFTDVEKKILAYARVLAQIDEFEEIYALHNLVDNAPKRFEGGNMRKSINKDLDDIGWIQGTLKHTIRDSQYNEYSVARTGYYTSLFLEMVENEYNGLFYARYLDSEGNEVNPDEGGGEWKYPGMVMLQEKIIEPLKHDIDIINKDLEVKENVVKEFLAEAGYPDLDLNLVKELYEKINVEYEEVNYTQPRIKRVIKHWYKDIDFSDAYEVDTEPIEMEYSGKDIGIDTNEWSIVVEITPKDEKYPYKQVKQPYVIKGDTVYLDGKVDEKRSESLNSKENKENLPKGYNWGDGYRATKKIFTQGFYYIYDGSEETAKSIDFQEVMEVSKGVSYDVSVQDGRIRQIKVLGTYGGSGVSSSLLDAETKPAHDRDSTTTDANGDEVTVKEHVKEINHYQVNIGTSEHRNTR